MQKQIPAQYKLEWHMLHTDCIALAKKIAKQYDIIMAISRGGLVVARILSDILDLPISHITIASYTDIQQHTEPVITEAPLKMYRGQHVLIVDEISDSGKTFERAISYLKQFPIASVDTASPYIKPKTIHKPTYWLKTINTWSVFPYEIEETKRLMQKSAKKK